MMGFLGDKRFRHGCSHHRSGGVPDAFRIVFINDDCGQVRGHILLAVDAHIPLLALDADEAGTIGVLCACTNSRKAIVFLHQRT